MNKSEPKKTFAVLATIGVCTVIVGVIGFLAPYGNERWNFIFENLIWLPLELALVVFIFDRLMKRNNERVAAKREFDEYFLLAEARLTELIQNLKLEMIKVYTGTVPQSHEETNTAFEDVFKNIDELINPAKLHKGIESPILDIRNIQFPPKYQRRTHLELSELAGVEIVFQIKGHFDLFIKYIPIGIFHNLDKIFICIDESMLFSENQNFKRMRDFLIYRDSMSQCQSEEYQSLSSNYITTFKEYYQLVIELEGHIAEKRA